MQRLSSLGDWHFGSVSGRWRLLLAAGAVLGLARTADAATYFVAADGDNANAGTLDKPFASIARGQQAATAGDTVYLRGGTFRFTSNSDANGIALTKSGTSGKPITYAAYLAEVPVFDFSGMTAAARITGVRVTASWIHLKGIEVKLVPQNLTDQNESWGVYNDGGDNNVYEMLNLHHNMGPGFFLGSGKDNLILNCDSHHNYDPKSKAGDGENADGFGCHPKAGDTGNVYRGIRAWWNTDDGFDSINAQAGCTVEGSWAWLNGLLPDTMKEPNRDPTLPPGNGNGFKLGGFGINGTGSPAVPPVHTIRNSVAFLNVFAGFFANYHTGGNAYYNNTGFKNGADFNMLGLNMVNTSLLRNNLALGPTPTANLAGTDAKNNSWNLAVVANDADFVSTATVGVDGPRQADGSLPNIPFMRLLAGSDLIDQGVDVGRPFVGSAPDLGAYELGDEVWPMAGSGGAAGSPGAGGSPGSGGTANAAGASAGVSGSLTSGSNAGGSIVVGAGSGSGGGVTDPGGPGSAGIFGGGGTLAGGGASNDAPASQPGCGCRAGRGRSPGGLAMLAAGLVLLTSGRPRAKRKAKPRRLG
jgi:hypothetical protein